MTTATTANLESIADKLAALNTYCYSDAAKPITEGLDYNQCQEVNRMVHTRIVTAAIEAFDTTPAIRAHLLKSVAQRGAQKPERADLTSMVKASQSTRDQYGKQRKPYAADPNCPLRMKLSEAVRSGYSQEAYADHSYYLVPVTGEIPADLTACRKNLSEFFRYSDTHTGWAGSGCNWSAGLETNEHGAFVVLMCRASIAD